MKEAILPKLEALLYFDYSQIELRLLAFYMACLGDHSMAQVYRKDEDLHEQSARAALGIYERELTDEERQVGKVLNFSLVYGGGRPTIMRQLGVTFPEANTLLKKFHERWPGIAVVQYAIDQQIESKGYIKTLWGRHLRPDSPHKRLNALVQGCAADLMRSSLVTVDERLQEYEKEAHLVLVVHDELVIDSPLDEVPFLYKEVPGWMDCAEVSEVVPITAGMEWTTTTWADKAQYKEEALV